MLLILLVCLVIMLFAGGQSYGGGRYRGPGFGLGALLLLILLFLLFTGRV